MRHSSLAAAEERACIVCCHYQQPIFRATRNTIISFRLSSSTSHHLPFVFGLSKAEVRNAFYIMLSELGLLALSTRTKTSRPYRAHDFCFQDEIYIIVSVLLSPSTKSLRIFEYSHLIGATLPALRQRQRESIDVA